VCDRQPYVIATAAGPFNRHDVVILLLSVKRNPPHYVKLIHYRVRRSALIEWWTYQVVKKFDDMFSCFDTIPIQSNPIKYSFIKKMPQST